MIAPLIATNEPLRLAALHATDLLDSPVEERFERITRLAQTLFNVPIVAVSLVDEDRQWFKSRIGLDAPETPRAVSFCGHAIQSSEIMIVSDALEDERFVDNPLVTGDPRIRFYAGCPIASRDGFNIGTLCLIDNKPRELTPEQSAVLRNLAGLVEAEISMTTMAIMDELTGLVNRRGFLLHGERVMAQCKRSNEPVGLMMIDVDNLKAVNDQFGHAAGDQILRAAADFLSQTFRGADLPARLGGDEFAVLLPGASLDSPATMIERFERDLQLYNDVAVQTLSLSAGIAFARADSGDGIRDVLEVADRQMFAYKLDRKKAPRLVTI